MSISENVLRQDNLGRFGDHSIRYEEHIIYFGLGCLSTSLGSEAPSDLRNTDMNMDYCLSDLLYGKFRFYQTFCHFFFGSPGFYLAHTFFVSLMLGLKYLLLPNPVHSEFSFILQSVLAYRRTL